MVSLSVATFSHLSSDLCENESQSGPREESDAFLMLMIKRLAKRQIDQTKKHKHKKINEIKIKTLKKL